MGALDSSHYSVAVQNDSLLPSACKRLRLLGEMRVFERGRLGGSHFSGSLDEPSSPN